MAEPLRLVFFDTNVWKFLIDEQACNALRQTLRARRLRGAVSPLVIDEIVRTQRETLRDDQLRAACRGWWRRLMPAGLLDVEQLVGAIRIRRPAWLKAAPDLRTWAWERGAYLDSPNGFWRTVRRAPAQYAASNIPNEDVRAYQQQITRQARSSVPGWNQANVEEFMSQMTQVEAPGRAVDGLPIAAWRYQAANLVSTELASSAMYRRWFECFIDARAVSEGAWWSFWAGEITPQEVSRHWLRPATFHLQAARKAGSGVAGDLIMTTHLIDVAFFVTFDRPFFEILERVVAAAPFPTAGPVLARSIKDLPSQLL
jgi:hypothetical protein